MPFKFLLEQSVQDRDKFNGFLETLVVEDENASAAAGALVGPCFPHASGLFRHVLFMRDGHVCFRREGLVDHLSMLFLEPAVWAGRGWRSRPGV